MKQFLILVLLRCAQVASNSRIEVGTSDSSALGTSREPDTTDLLQAKVLIQAAIDTESNKNVEASTSTEYVPGTPGAPWTEAEMLAIKAKLWHVLSLTQMEVAALYASLHGDGYADSQHYFRGLYMGRMPATWNRLGFHGCLPDEDSDGKSSGCDGCLYWDGIGHVYLDYFAQTVIPVEKGHNAAPNFNNGLGPAVEILEMIYRNGSWPEKTPVMEKSLFETGKSRADLWAFAGSNAVEFGVFLNNMICQFPDFEMKNVFWPDSLESNSWYSQHCNQFYGTPNCTVDLGKGFDFKTGRKDCKPMAMYKKIAQLTCPQTLQIKTEKECQAAASELALDKAKVQFVDEGGYPVCKYQELEKGAYDSLCYKSLDDEYNGGKFSYYMQKPIYDHGKPCRADLTIMTREECKEAAEYSRLPWGEETLGIQGCYIVDYTEPHWVLTWKVHFGEGDPPPKDSTLKDYYPSWGTGYGKILKAVCRNEAEPLRPYMASTWGGGPNSQMNGEATVKFFKESFGGVGWTRRDTVAILGAHTQGRFHAIADIFRYIWVRNGGMVFNNAYYRNIAQRPDWRFQDPNCRRIGTAYGQKGPVRWTAFRRYEQVNKGPVNWVLERYVCADDCHLEGAVTDRTNACCQDIPENGFCRPDNKRGNVTDFVAADDDVNQGCERWFTEGGQHESATPAEMGLYFKFEVDENDVPYGCPGLEPDRMDTLPSNDEVGCPKNDMSLDEGNDMSLYQLIELYADDQQAWIRDFIVAWDKMNENGYQPGELVDGPLNHKEVVCPTQESVIYPNLEYWMCFSVDDLDKHLSDPFLLVSHLDGSYLQIDPAGGEFQLGKDVQDCDNRVALSHEKPCNDMSGHGDPMLHQIWYTATTPNGKVLVNGMKQYGVGNLTYDAEHHLLLGGGGLLMREPNTMDNAKLYFAKDKHVSWISAGWQAIGLNEHSPKAKLPACLALKTVHNTYVTTGSDGVLTARAGSPTNSEEFQVTMNSDGTISFKGANGKYISAEEGRLLSILDNNDKGVARFTWMRNMDGTISIKTGWGRYWAAQAVGSVDAKTNCEKFIKYDNADGTVAYLSAWGLYIVEQWDGYLNADRTWAGPWNHFKSVQNDDSTISLLTDRGYYIKAEGSGLVDAFEQTIGPKHKFKEIQNDDGTVSLKTDNGGFLVGTGEGKLYDRKEMAAGAWENFVPALCNLKDIVGSDCPLSCYSPLCISGSAHNGGMMLNGNVCENICSVEYSGTRYCGTGKDYELGGSVDCTGCANT
mmetsp:Transcript_40090/g.69518  ORF Transcript_40090/g.69518 Transcript_40090/m.69518 type:complete len:1256 (-) Transcript_40090:279-4046(-)